MTYETARCPICRYGVCPRSHSASIIEFSKCVRRHQVTKLFGFPSQPFRFKKGVTASVSPCCISTMVPYWSKVRTFISRLKTSSMPVSSNKQDVSSPHWVERRHPRSGDLCPLFPRKRTLQRAIGMSALCQKQTFGPLLDIIVSGQGCSSSWSITRETSP